MDKAKQYAVLLRPHERQWLAQLTQAAGLWSEAECLRQVLRAAWERWQREHSKGGAM